MAATLKKVVQARIKSNKKRTADALVWLRDAADLNYPEDAVPYKHLMAIYRKSRKLAKAWQQWEGTADTMLDPETIEAACGLSELVGVDPFALSDDD